MSQGDFKEKEKEQDQKLVESSDQSGGDIEAVAAHEDELIGKTIGGHYHILARIGSGGMSTVYKARHEHLEKNVAIKFIEKKYVQNETTLSRFKTEAKVLAALDHENICGINEFEILEDGSGLLVMDFIEGSSLAEVLAKQGKLEVEEAMEFMAQISAALSYAHSMGIIHRDIKPANVVLQKNNDGTKTVKLVDFGIAKLIRDDAKGPNLTQTGEVFGTPNYMSPEQCYGKKIDVKTDIYSFGCVFYELLAGTPPFAGDSSLEIIMKHVNDTPPDLSLVKEYASLNHLIRKCMKKESSDRYTDFNLLQEDLKAIRASETPGNLVVRKSLLDSLIHKTPLVFFSTLVLIIVSCVVMFFVSSFSNLKYEGQWKKAYTIAEKQLETKNLVAAEASLEKSLVLAKKSKNAALITLTMKELQGVEKALGKEDEAKEHNPKSNVLLDALRKFFLNIAWICILLGAGIFVFTLFLFGPKGYFNTKLKLSKKDPNRKYSLSDFFSGKD